MGTRRSGPHLGRRAAAAIAISMLLWAAAREVRGQDALQPQVSPTVIRAPQRFDTRLRRTPTLSIAKIAGWQPPTGPQPPDHASDLTMTSFEVRCRPPGGVESTAACGNPFQPNREYSVYAKIANIGDQGASFENPGSTWDGWVVASMRSNITNPLKAPVGGLWIAPGATAGYQIGDRVLRTNSLVLGPGTHHFIFRADPDDHIVETNESNNEVDYAITVVDPNAPPAAVSDLRITSIAVSPASGPPSTAFRITPTVSASGADVSGDFKVQCTPGGYIVTVSGGLAAGQSTQAPFPPIDYQLAPGTKTATCTVDNPSQIAETDENNNSLSTTFTVTQP